MQQDWTSSLSSRNVQTNPTLCPCMRRLVQFQRALHAPCSESVERVKIYVVKVCPLESGREHASRFTFCCSLHFWQQYSKNQCEQNFGDLWVSEKLDFPKFEAWVQTQRSRFSSSLVLCSYLECTNREEKQKSSFRRCSRCHGAKYCSVQCQRLHWTSIHKHQCRAQPCQADLSSPSFLFDLETALQTHWHIQVQCIRPLTRVSLVDPGIKVSESKGKGKGWFAIQALPKGKVVLVETGLLFQRDTVWKGVYALLCSPEFQDQAFVDRLHDPTLAPDTNVAFYRPHGERTFALLRLLQAKTVLMKLQFWNPVTRQFFLACQASLFNHCNPPNVNHTIVWKEGEGSISIQTTRDILPGEELTLYYSNDFETEEGTFAAHRPIRSEEEKLQSEKLNF